VRTRRKMKNWNLSNSPSPLNDQHCRGGCGRPGIFPQNILR
jgi:hypothetical protein